MQIGASIQPRMVGAPVERVDSLDRQPIRWTPDEYVAGENTWFALPSTVIAANTALVQIGPIQPERPIAVTRFVCPSTIISLLFNQFRINGTELLPSSNGIACELFSEVSTAPNIDWLTINTSPGVVVLVSNPTANPITLAGAGFYGTQLRS